MGAGKNVGGREGGGGARGGGEADGHQVCEGGVPCVSPTIIKIHPGKLKGPEELPIKA